MAKPSSAYATQAVFLANQAGLNKPGLNKPRAKARGPNNQASIAQVAVLYKAGYHAVLGDWVRVNYPCLDTQNQVLGILECALENEICTLAEALMYIEEYILKG